MDESNKPRVAIIVRTKDRPELLRRALKSIMSQRFVAWEAVIVNDGGAAHAVESLIGELPLAIRAKVTHVVEPHSLGRWPAANIGIAASSAPLIVLHDDDDSWHPDFLSATVSYLDDNTDQHGVVARIEVIIEDEVDGDLVEHHRYVLEDHNEEILLTDLLEFNRFVPIGFVYRRALHDLLGPYNESLPAAGDWAFNLSVVALQPVRYVSERPLAYWHQRPSATGNTGNSVHAATADHSYAARAFRDQAMRDFVQRVGLGLPLYASATTAAFTRQISELTERTVQLTHALERLETRADHLQQQNDRILHDLSRTMDTRVRGWVVRQKQRFRRD